MAFLLAEKTNNFEFDQTFIQKIVNIYDTKINRLVIKYIFIVNIFEDISVDTIFYKFG
jgi:hypothetical protein